MEQKKKTILVICLVAGVVAFCLLSCCVGGLLFKNRNDRIQEAREAEEKAYEELFKAADKAQEMLKKH